MPRKSKSQFFLTIPINFTMKEETSYTEVQEFIKEFKILAKRDLFLGEIIEEVSLGKVIIQKNTTY